MLDNPSEINSKGAKDINININTMLQCNRLPFNACYIFTIIGF